MQWIELSAVLNESIETLRSTAQAKGVFLQAWLDPFARPIYGDPNRLQQVFWNLLNNAIKFTPKDGKVEVLLKHASTEVQVSVIDTGEGIAPEFLPYIFDRFQQGDASTTRRHGGLGLGLAIVKQLVELHGGNVRVQSDGLGKGATFSVRLPLTAVYSEPEKEGHPPEATPRENHPMPEVSLAGIQVLVVDDEIDARDLVKKLLETAGATVSTAGSASEAMEHILAGRPDVLVCDIGMQEEDGYSLIRRLRSHRKERRRCLARGRVERICAIGGSHESHPVRFSDSLGKTCGTDGVARCNKQPGRTGGDKSVRRLVMKVVANSHRARSAAIQVSICVVSRSRCRTPPLTPPRRRPSSSIEYQGSFPGWQREEWRKQVILTPAPTTTVCLFSVYSDRSAQVVLLSLLLFETARFHGRVDRILASST